jgi:predicted MFS family arabinose efflux permease
VGSRVVLGSETGGGAAHNVDLPDFGERVSETLRPLFWLALALSVGAAVSLGVTRFAYGLLLPGMRTDLGWTYTLAGAMNTANAVGYLLGALAMPALMRRISPCVLLWTGCLLAALFMGLCGFFTDATVLLVQRLLAGVASALVFVAGGLLAARLGSRAPAQAALLLGVYYGGTGLGITLSALLVPWVLDAFASQPHSWRFAWWALALLCFAATALLRWPARVMAQWEQLPAATAAGGGAAFRWRPFGFALAGYCLFGVGYIGYMTFAVALLRTQGAGAQAVTLFYGLLGLAVVASSRIWAGLLNRHQGGGAMSCLNALLGLAVVLPALTQSFSLIVVSGLLFGGVFLSIVASSTALVRHNLAPSVWAEGISAFTVVFAAGQIVGPTLVGWIADGAGGLQRGLLVSALALWLGAVLAWRQRPLDTMPVPV